MLEPVVAVQISHFPNLEFLYFCSVEDEYESRLDLSDLIDTHGFDALKLIGSVDAGFANVERGELGEAITSTWSSRKADSGSSSNFENEDWEWLMRHYNVSELV